jgi:NDP-sugar pyrophosphorylase family protein
MAEVASALVLTAGLGTRLRPLTLVRAKPAVPVAGEPLIRRIARWLTAANVSNLTLNLHHLPATITSVMGDGSDLGATVRYSWEQPTVLGSAGGPRQALPIVGADTFFIVNGDTLTDVDLDALSEAHRRAGALVTLALIPNIEPLKYGGVTLDAHAASSGLPRDQARRAATTSSACRLSTAAPLRRFSLARQLNRSAMSTTG